MASSTNKAQQQTGAASTNMSISIGGRIVTPALPVVDATPSSYSPLEQSFDEILTAYTSSHIPLESKTGIERRERVLNRMGVLCREWIQSVCRRLSLPNDIAQNAGGELYTSGSYRLGVHEPGADIDTILVAPNMCTRQDFFGSGYVDGNGNDDGDGMGDDGGGVSNVRDPESLAERIRKHPDVTNFVPVENAAVPILTFDWEGVNIDLLFARLNTTSIPPDFDIDNDAVLDGVDPATEKSLNGPRVTNLIAALVRGTPERYQTFLRVVRCVRKWAKARGLYSNKMGYWGGVNINIAVALVIQLYPNACAASLLRKFFLVFKSWRWPNPVMLTKPHDANLGLVVWNAYHVNNMRQVAPIITPAYPAMNSTLSVSRQTLQIMHEEFCRGHDILDRLWKNHQKCGGNYTDTNPINTDHTNLPENIFHELFEPSDFFISYPHYLSICIAGATEMEAQSWAGFVESRLRKLVSDMLGKSLPLSKIQLWPKKFEACIADRMALLTPAQRRNCISYFVGFQIDTLRMRGNQLNVEQQMQNFREWELSRFQPLQSGMDVLVKPFKVKELPKICFEGMYEGGKIAAMKRRRQIRDADPQRMEEKRKKKLEQLRMKRAEIKRKQEEMVAAIQKKKRKQEELDNTATTATAEKEEEKSDAVKDEPQSDTTMNETTLTTTTTASSDLTNNNNNNNNTTNVEEFVASKEEEALLENALDRIQNEAGDGAKTREEAELDRKKLLAGELLVEGGGGGLDEDDGAIDNLLGYDSDGGVRNVTELETNGGATTNSSNENENQLKGMSLAEQEAEILHRSGLVIVSDDEMITVGGNVVHPWRALANAMYHDTSSENTAKKETDDNDDDNDAERTTNEKSTSTSISTTTRKKPIVGMRIKFKTQFDIVELDVNGHVVDKGDDDYMPSKCWNGRQPGFEFKLGARGLGYYRTGKEVVVPSNTAY